MGGDAVPGSGPPEPHAPLAPPAPPPTRRPPSRVRRSVGQRLVRTRRGVPAQEVRHALGARDRFRRSRRPVLRWIKGDGRDDAVTRAALAQATRLFGASVDYCLCTVDLSRRRAAAVAAWATQPVHWWPVRARDHAGLASALRRAGCPRDDFGYWWKWFPARVRPDAPEWILDGDMVVVDRPPWFDAWTAGTDPVRVAQSPGAPLEHYGEYAAQCDRDLMFYSGLVSLPPGVDLGAALLDVLRHQPLRPGHDGRRNMSEQGVVAAAAGALGAVPIPLHEFPFAVAGHAELTVGPTGPVGPVWGYHFGNAFRGPNEWFDRLTRAGIVFSADADRGHR
jgi:hypothetical protein